MCNRLARRVQIEITRKLIGWRRYDQAQRILRYLLAKDETDFNAWFLLGWCYSKQKDLESATGAYDRALQIKPDLSYAHAEMGSALAQLRRYKEGAEYLRRAIRVQPNLRQKFTYVYALAICAARLDELDESLALFTDAFQLDPSFDWALVERGWVLLKLNRYEEAVQILQRAVSLFPDNATVYQYLGTALVELERFSEAEATLRQATVLAPEDGPTRFNYGRSLTELGRFDEAISELEEACRLSPSDGAYAGLWIAHCNLQNWQNALDAAEELQRRAPGEADPRAFRALALIGLHRLEEAEIAIREALHLDPHCQSAYETLCQLYLVREEFDQSLEIALSGKVSPKSATGLLTTIGEEHLNKRRLERASQIVAPLRNLNETAAQELEEKIAKARSSQD